MKFSQTQNQNQNQKQKRRMVVFHIKHTTNDNNNDGFLYETTLNTKNEDLIKSLITIYNLRIQSMILIDAVKEGLALYGIMKQPGQHVGCRDEVHTHKVIYLFVFYTIYAYRSYNLSY